MNSTYERIIKPTGGMLPIDFKELWRYHELLGMLILREVRGRYRQSALGFTWAFIPPLVQMFIFTIIFGNVAKLGPDGVPYPIFCYAALLPWTYFSRALTGAGQSLLAQRNLLTKVYFPRLILPLTGVAAALIDFVIAFVVMVVLMVWFGLVPGWEIIMLPFFIVIAVLTAFGVGMWLTALSVKYRDIKFATPFLVQTWMFITPVIFSVDKIPDKYQVLLWMNPMTGVIEGFRWSLLGQPHPNWQLMILSLGIVFIFLVIGAFYFKQMERTFADII